MLIVVLPSANKKPDIFSRSEGMGDYSYSPMVTYDKTHRYCEKRLNTNQSIRLRNFTPFLAGLLAKG